MQICFVKAHPMWEMITDWGQTKHLRQLFLFFLENSWKMW